jgi:hypothetical protein
VACKHLKILHGDNTARCMTPILLAADAADAADAVNAADAADAADAASITPHAPNLFSSNQQNQCRRKYGKRK